MTIGIVDYGAGNVPSVERALHKLGAKTERVNNAEQLVKASAIILPGVGHYAALIRAVDTYGLRQPLIEATRSGKPLLGICLGLQALYESSDEAPELTGLGVLPGRVRTLPSRVKLPHMGWNQLQIRQRSKLLEGLTNQDYFYFAHTFAAQVKNGETVAVCDYGSQFAAVVEAGRMCAVQFHPEKSGASGVKLLANFLRMAA